MADERGIGVFDSGLGGLTMVKEIAELLPCEDMVYFGDTGRVPYGNKSDSTVREYVKNDINFLLRFDLKLIVAACGTASAIALPYIKDSYPIPVFGVVEAAAESAVRLSRNRKIGIIGTEGTIKSDMYARLIGIKDSGIYTISAACPLFVPLVENGYADSEAAELVAADYLAPFKRAEVDTLIMGCTHYPHLENTIRKVMGSEVRLVNPSKEAAVFIKRYLKERNQAAESGKAGLTSFYVSDDAAGFSELGSKFLGHPISGEVVKIDIGRYAEKPPSGEDCK